LIIDTPTTINRHCNHGAARGKKQGPDTIPACGLLFQSQVINAEDVASRAGGAHLFVLSDCGGAAERAETFLQAHLATRERFDRVVDLIEGFETSYGMELLSTVYWVANQEGAKPPEEATDKTYAWNDRKRMFRPEHIHKAWDILDQKGWLTQD